MRIVIDPGHGGNDTGAPGPTGLNESDVALTIAQLVVAGLSDFDLETKLTRNSDVFIELENRCAIANGWGADYFVSIHCNSNGPTAVGIETLYVSAKGEALAKPIQEAMVAATGDVDRGLKYRSDLYVLNGTNMPAALAETGFISNPQTEELFRQNEYLATIAEAIVMGIAKHLDLLPSSPPLT